MSDSNAQKTVLANSYERIDENGMAIDTLSTFIVDSNGGCTDKDDIDIVMLLIGRLAREIKQANDDIRKVTKGNKS